jgi:hypothetical protein
LQEPQEKLKEPGVEREWRISPRSSLDALVVGIELTLASIIQGVALYFLTNSAYALLGGLEVTRWIYVFNGLLLIFLFWSRSVTHTLTLIRWPLEFLHNFFYIAATLLQASSYALLQEPLKWFSLQTAFAAVVWLLFVVDLRLIRQRIHDAQDARQAEVFSLIERDQNLNIWLLIPGFLAFHGVAAGAIAWLPDFFERQQGHLIFAFVQAAAFFLYLVYVLIFFRRVIRRGIGGSVDG